MKGQIQFELWQDCNSKCDFCYLNWFSIDRSKEYKLKRIHEVLTTLSDDSLYDSYDTVSLIGGEFFQGQINDPDVKEAFFTLIRKIRSLLDEGKIERTWIMVSLLIGNQPDLYKCLDILGNDSRVWFNTSWDISGRFKSEKMRNTWEGHMLKIHELFPNVNLNTTMILTHDLVSAYVKDEFSFSTFCQKYHTHLFLKPPSYNEVTSEVYSRQYPDAIKPSHVTRLYVKEMFSQLIHYTFFPSRKEFLNFLMKYKNEMGVRAYRDLFNIERRADDLYATASDGHTERKRHREKQGNGFGNTDNHINSCGHSCYYESYSDCNGCMLCDKEFIGSL